MIEAATRAGIPYVDTAAEIEVLSDMFTTYANRDAAIVPAAALYGGLGDLLATAASGQDIYAVSAPIAVEATHRAITGQTKTAGIASTGKMFDAADFLNALSKHITLTE